MNNMNHQLVTLSQLQQHDGVKNSQLWILLYGKVYDVTQFADKHPGGREMIESACARNATALFESYHLSSQSISKLFLKSENNQNSIIKYIGEFDENSIIETRSNQEAHLNDSLVKFNFRDGNKLESRKKNIYEIMKEEVRHELYPSPTNQESKLNIRSVSGLRLLNAIFIFTVLLTCQIVSQYLTSLHLSLAIILGLIAGIFHHLALVHVAHDLGHGSFTDFPILWRMFGNVCSCTLGHSFYLWTIRHNVAHHVYTNMSEIDPDIGIYEQQKKNLFERSIPDKSHPKSSTPIKIMTLTGSVGFLPVMYGLVVFYMQIKDFAHYWNRRVSDGIQFAAATWSFTTFHFYGSKIFFFMYRMVLPIILFYTTDGRLGRNLLEATLIFTASEVAAGLFFGFFSQINHISEKCKFPLNSMNKDESTNEDELDWATVQIKTSVDYCLDSYVWTYLSGFLNHQVIHHLFPTINPWLYPKIVPIVKKVCMENNIEYNIYDNFLDALNAHVNQVTTFVNKKQLLKNKILDH